MEKELFVRLALCVDPRKGAASGISKQAIRSFGVGATGLSEKERRIREALRYKILKDIKPLTSDMQVYVLPGLGPHPGFPAEQQLQMEIPADMVHAVAKKILRGCEYWLGSGRIIEPPYDIEVFFPRETPQDVLQVFAPFGPVYLGPGCRIRRAEAKEDSGVAMYEIVIWGSLTIYYSILPPEEIGPAKS